MVNNEKTKPSGKLQSILLLVVVCFLVAIPQVSAFDWTDTDAYWKLDETSGTFADSANSYDLTNTGAVYGGSDNGIIGNATYSNSIGDRLTSSTSPSINGNFTISTWLYRTGEYLTGNNAIIDVGDFGSNDGFGMWIGGTYDVAVNQLTWRINQNYNHYNASMAIPLNTWAHAVITYDGTNVKMYLDGVLKTTDAHTTDPSVPSDIQFFSREHGGETFVGRIDETGLWSKALSQTDITELYNSGSGLTYGDTYGPTITLIYPVNDTIISDVGTNFTVSGNNLSDVAGEWTNVTYNVWQNSTLVNSTTVDFTDDITFNETLYIDNFGFKDYEWNAEACYTNITGDYCVNATNNNTFSVSLFTIISESYVNDTVSGTLENFSISIDLLEGYSLSAASFMYNGTDNSPSITAEGDNRFLLVSDYQIPILVTDENVTFYWGMTFTGDVTFNSTEKTQLVRAVLLDNCSVYTYQLFNISLFDEELKTSLVGDIEITYTLLNMPSYQTINIYSFKQNNISNVGVCSGINLSSESLAYSAEIRYVSDNYAPELYHIQRAATGTGIQSINLFDLHDNESTEFKLTYQDDTFNFVDGAIIQLQRKYISEGIYEVVEAPLTSRDGVAVVHVDLNSIKYKATVVKNGVVLDIFDNLVFKCESELTGECTQKLLGGINPQNSKEVANLIDFSYLISSVNNTITTTFTIPSGTSSLVNILLVQVDNFGTTTLCNSTVISSAGSIDCTYNDTIGDSRVFLTISKDGVIVVNQGYFIPENINLGFAGNNYIIVLLLLLTLVGMAFASPEWIVIIGVVAFFIAGGLWLLNGMNLVIGLGTMMFVVIAVAILIKEMTKQED